MADYITIDGGTTNTRISVVRSGKVTDVSRLSVGARDGKQALTAAVKEGIADILTRNRMSEQDVTRILASGMITSEFGLCELPHIAAPAGPCELHAAMREVVIDEISAVPFCFVRGVKSADDTLENADMMRGEETELAGLFDGAGVYILSGSHSKIVSVDADGRICWFKTMLTGEMITALRENTILQCAVKLGDQPLLKEWLVRGYDYANRHGMNEALFKVRVLKNMFNAGDAELYNFYMGVLLCDEIQYVLSLSPERVVVSGQRQIKDAVAVLLSCLTTTAVVTVPTAVSDTATAMGLVRIYERA